MKLGYVREDGTGPTKESQRDKLRGAGIIDFRPEGPVYEDLSKRKYGKVQPTETKARDQMIRDVRAGDLVVVASPSRLGTGRRDIMEALRSITDKGAAVFDASTGATVVMALEAEIAFGFIDRAESERQAHQLEQMRRKKVAMGAKGGAPKKFTAKRRAEAKRLWADMNLTAAQAAERAGISVRTGYRLFGTRGVPTLPPKEPSE